MYITDMGMCGVFDSVLGDEKEQVVNRFRTGVFEPLSVAVGNEFLINGVILDFSPLGNKIIRINRKVKL
jgi:calcineurin-like phosphoesterase